MLSREDNDILIHTGPGTLMGNLLRRYWLPACLTREIPKTHSKLLDSHTLGTHDTPRESGVADYFPPPTNWGQALEGTIDTTHPAWLHAWKGAADIEDDGSDAPGMYNSGKMQWKFWAHDRAP